MRLDQSRISEKYLIDYKKRYAAADKINKKLARFYWTIARTLDMIINHKIP